ncbi:MAG: TonB-dependent receptor [Gammaproteobacteria bacterium]|nr:MAG: TonB-dependent receptor [Gammaproteobacteria bacterium]
MNNQRKLLIAVAVSSVLYGPTILAEETEKSNVVIVTAQKRAEPLIEVPIAISVFDSEAIDQTGIQGLVELGDSIPNLHISQQDDFESRITIRGVGAESRNIGFDSRVGVYIDGVYLGQSPAVNQDLIDLEQIEVLRGPQGTIFGKNTVAGAISLISVKPHEDLEGSINVNLANFNGVEIKGDINVPLSDEFAVKAAFSSRTRDGYIDNVYNDDQVPTEVYGLAPFPLPVCDEGCPFPAMTPTDQPETNEKYNNQDTQSYRVQFRYQPTEQLDINLTFDGLQSEANPATSLAATDSFGTIANPFATGEHEVSFSATPKEERDIFGSNLNIDYAFENDFNLRSITAYRDTEASTFQDIDFSPIDYLTSHYVDNFEQVTQEFQLISPDDGDFKYVVGLYYYQQEGKTDRSVDMGNAGYWFLDPDSDPVESSRAYNAGIVDTESVAIFFNGSYQISEKWDLGFGLRYSEETKDADWILDGPNLSNIPITDTPEGGFHDTHKDTNFAPTISLNYAVSDNGQIYAKYSTGFKSGGFNLDWVDETAYDQGIEFDKETVESYELGYKTKALDNRLSVSTALFISNYDDYQVNQFFDLGTGEDGQTLTSVRITNAAKVETSGLEIEARYLLTDDFTINGSLGLLDATFDDFPDGTTDPETGDPINAAGNRLPFASEFNATLGLQYYKEVSSLDADLLIRLDVNHIGDYYTDIDNAELVDVDGFGLNCMFYPETCGQGATISSGHVDAYTLVNARIGLIDLQGGWEVYLWGRNLTDEDQSLYSGTQFLGTLIYSNQTPRTYGIEATYNF